MRVIVLWPYVLRALSKPGSPHIYNYKLKQHACQSRFCTDTITDIYDVSITMAHVAARAARGSGPLWIAKYLFNFVVYKDKEPCSTSLGSFSARACLLLPVLCVASLLVLRNISKLVTILSHDGR